jgi:hypothetical protein
MVIGGGPATNGVAGAGVASTAGTTGGASGVLAQALNNSSAKLTPARNDRLANNPSCVFFITLFLIGRCNTNRKLAAYNAED